MTLTDSSTAIIIALITALGALAVAWVQDRRKRRSTDQEWQDRANELDNRLAARNEATIRYLEAQVAGLMAELARYHPTHRAHDDDKPL